tara:strand:- start:86 stop:307 length:222 start_codon:yes stop_codon:yes gene_type:complete
MVFESNFIKKVIEDGLIEHKPKIIENQWSIQGSTGNDYTVKLNDSGSYECNCIGFRRVKDGKCKHIKQVINKK